MKSILDKKLTQFRKFDIKHKKALERLGLETVEDLILYFPVRYEDFSNISKIKDLKVNEKQTVKGIVKSIENAKTSRKQMQITKALISDDTGSIKIVWFNQPYLENFLPIGTYVTLNGKVEMNYQGLTMVSPSYEKYRPDHIHTGRIVPIYSETSGLSSKWLRFILKPLLKFCGEFDDFLPEDIKKKLSLLDLSEALKQIHFSDNLKILKKARLRLAFDELFLLQLNNLLKKKKWRENSAYKIKFEQKLIQKFVKSLPFELTKDQKISAWEIFKDLEKNKPMNRLLEGDVGSGKTVVGLMAMLLAVRVKKQAILMAPTEILAKQHYVSILRMCANSCLQAGRAGKVAQISQIGRQKKIQIGLLTRIDHKINERVYSKKKLLEKIGRGEVDILIGTHAIIQENVRFKNLALSIVDEQHRFGVEQRMKIKKINKSKKVPHLLSMTATPIPRTMALSIYGDLDISIISEMPKGRKDVITKLVAPFDREKAYDFIREKINSGQQVFVVCPRIKGEETNSNNLWADVKAVEEEYKKLDKEVFPDFEIKMMHGKLKKEEKEKILEKFKNNKIKILVSTSVIEVGIDFPNASIMMIEGAERFGLSQLHQFRGRVGRGKNQSYCFLFSDSLSKKSYDRLTALISCNDGFKLAEKDLKIRGPGEVYGLRQSGIPDLKMASLMDINLLKLAQKEAAEFIKNHDIKKFPNLREKLGSFNSVVHLE